MSTSVDTERISDATSHWPSPSQRPSYFDFLSTTGLRPAQHSFDEGVIRNLDLDLFDDSGNSDGKSADEEKLKTFLRIRPSTQSGGGSGKHCIEVKDTTTVVAYSAPKPNAFQDRIRKPTEFKFTKVLGPDCGQSTIFEECVAPIINKFMRHENCLIFSYGATNSGKTYTMQGYGTEFGIIPRTLEAIFNRINDRQYKVGNIRPHLYQAFQHLSQQELDSLHERRNKIISDSNLNKEVINSYRLTCSSTTSTSSNSQCSDRSGVTVDLVGVSHVFDAMTCSSSTLYSVWVSFAELYNERVYDLLDTSTFGKNKRRKELKLMQDRNGYVYIKDLTEYPVTTEEEAYRLFQAGKKHLQFAATQMNQTSSRSHSFFTLRIVSIGMGEGMVPYPRTVHRMTFCDLAGMERANQTENKGGRLLESGNINNSLTVLLKVIRVLRERQAHHGVIETIPFRESKLTHIFKSYFTSATHICMLVNVNPDPIVADSTIQVLQNSAIASNVVVFRPIDVNVEVAKPIIDNHLKDVRFLATKPPLPPRRPPTRGDGKCGKPIEVLVEPEKNKKCPFDSSDSDDEGNYGAETVVAPKTMLQRIKVLEDENSQLRTQLQNVEKEKLLMGENFLRMMNEERMRWRVRERERSEQERGQRKTRRRMALVHQPVSPGSKFGCFPPRRVDMEDIDETFEEDDGMLADSDKEN